LKLIGQPVLTPRGISTFAVRDTQAEQIVGAHPVGPGLEVLVTQCDQKSAFPESESALDRSLADTLAQGFPATTLQTAAITNSISHTSPNIPAQKFAPAFSRASPRDLTVPLSRGISLHISVKKE